jgi:hypothetical protein
MYFSPEPHWKMYGIKSRKAYIDKFVIKGRFHDAVHKDVLKSYKTVEYLMAHAYYHWPMYDEALKKLLGIFEMAIKLRCKELNISLETIDRNGKKRKRFLGSLIKSLCDKGYPDALKSTMDRLRSLRNHHSHPDRHSFAGATSSGSIKPIVNLLNQLFLPVDSFIEKQTVQNEFKSALAHYTNKLLIVPYDRAPVLMYNPRLISSEKLNNEWFHFITFEAVVNNPKEYLNGGMALLPPTTILGTVEFEGNSIHAYQFETNSVIEIKVTSKEENIMRWEKQVEAFNTLEGMDKYSLTSIVESTIHKRLNDWVYHLCWPSMEERLKDVDQ